MNIQGLQKTTLLDYPQKVACLVFTGGCNLNCPFCQNSELIKNVPKPQVTVEELMAFLKKRIGLLDGVVVTGGEPLLQSDIKELLATIKALGYLIKLDTNGCYPEKLQELIDLKLVDYVAMDIKNSKNSYAKTVGMEQFDTGEIDKSIKILMNSQIEYEFRTTLVDELHTEKDIEEIGEWIRGAKVIYLQSFKDSEYVKFSGFHAPAPEKIDQYKQILQNFVGITKIR